MTQTGQISLTDAEALIAAAICNSGATAQDSAIVARALAAAEAEGQAGHGFSRIDDYAAQLRSGKINPRPDRQLYRDTPVQIRVDADCGFAYPALDMVIETGIDVAREYGVAIMSVANSHHCGALGQQVERLAQAGLIGLMVANAPPAIAPWGAREPMFGTNPIAFAVPRADAPPLVIDLSLSVVARGKVMAARKAGTAIPEGWALDREGRPTTDPEAALAGTMLPIGGAKGTALALIVEILAAVFTGSALSSEASSFFAPEGAPPRVGQFLLAIDPGPRQPAFAARLGGLLETLAAMDGVRLPGDRRLGARARSEAEGLQVPVRFLDSVRALAGAGA